MKNLLWIIVILLGSSFLCNKTFAQRKIATNVYMYGNVKGKIKDNVCVFFQGADPKMSSAMLKSFKKYKIKAVSLYDFILPGEEISDDKLEEIVQDNNIQTIMIIAIGDITQTVTEKNVVEMYTAGNYAIAQSGKSTQVWNKNLQLSVCVYTQESLFDKKEAVIYSEINSAFRAVYNQSNKALSKKCVERILAAIKKENKKK